MTSALQFSDLNEPPMLKWTPLVEGIRLRRGDAMEEFHANFKTGIRCAIGRRLGADDDLEESVQECITTVMKAVQRGMLSDPERLPGLVRTIVSRHIAARIAARVEARNTQEDSACLDWIAAGSPSPEEEFARNEIRNIARRVLAAMGGTGREVLMRFYVYEQSREEICEALGLSYDEFRNIKCRTKSLFAERCREEMRPRRKGVQSSRSAVNRKAA